MNVITALVLGGPSHTSAQGPSTPLLRHWLSTKYYVYELLWNSRFELNDEWRKWVAVAFCPDPKYDTRPHVSSQLVTVFSSVQFISVPVIHSVLSERHCK